MTVETQVTKVQANGNGSATVFSYDPIVIYETTDIEVTLTDTLTGVDTPLSEGTGASAYSVIPASGTYPSTFGVTGSVQYPEDEVTPILATDQLTIKRVLPLEQLTDLENQGGYFPDVQEVQFDKGVMQTLQQEEDIGRAIKAPVTDVAPDMDLPNATDRANQFLGFDSSGDVQMQAAVTGVTVTAFWQGIIDGTSNTRGSLLRGSATVGETEILANGTVAHVVQSDGTDVVFGQLAAGAFADDTIAVSKLADATDGELITWDSSGVVTTIAPGTVDHVLTSNGAGAEPTYQDIDQWSAWLKTDLTNAGADDTTTWELYTGLSNVREVQYITRNARQTGAEEMGFQLGHGSTTWVTTGYENHTTGGNASNSHAQTNTDLMVIGFNDQATYDHYCHGSMYHMGSDEWIMVVDGVTWVPNYNGAGQGYMDDLTAELTGLRFTISLGVETFDLGDIWTRWR